MGSSQPNTLLEASGASIILFVSQRTGGRRLAGEPSHRERARARRAEPGALGSVSDCDGALSMRNFTIRASLQ